MRYTIQAPPSTASLPTGTDTLPVSPYDFPLWMRQAQRGTDWGLVLVIAAALCLAWSYILRPELPTYNMTLNYAFQAADTAEALREGRLYPRWSSHVLSGYGAPIPNYYPPGAAYTVAVVEVLLTDDTFAAMRVVYAATLCLAACFVYALASRWLGARGGILASLLYVYCPYVGMVAPHLVGDLPGVLAFALLPGVLWAVNRLLMLNRPMDVVYLVLFTAALILTDPRALFPAGIFALILVAHQLTTSNPRIRIVRVMVGVFLGICLSAMFWLPALAERDFVQWVTLDSSAGSEPQHLTLAGMLTPLQPIDPLDLKPMPQFTLGWVLTAFALLGVLGTLRNATKYRYALLFALTGTSLMLVSLVIFPTQTWLLGAISLCYAISATGILGFRDVFPQRIRRLFVPVLCAIILIGSMYVWLVPENSSTRSTLTPLDQLQYEQQEGSVAVLPSTMPVPVTISPSLAPNRPLTLSYLDAYQDLASPQPILIDKVAPPQINRYGQIVPIQQASHFTQYQIRTDQPASNCPPGQPRAECRTDQPIILNWLTAYFPGWEAVLNGGIPLNANRNPQTGLIDVQIPRTLNGELTLTLNPTPTRTLAWAISWAALFVVVVITRRRFHEQYQQRSVLYDDLKLLTVPETRLILVVVGCFVVILGMVVRPDSPVLLRPLPYQALKQMTPYTVQTDTGLQLLGYRLQGRWYAPNETIEVTFYWRALRTLSENYLVHVYLQDVNRQVDNVWASQPLRFPGGAAPRRWQTTGYIRDTYTLELPADIFAGSYKIVLEVCIRADAMGTDCDNSTRLTFFEPTGRNPQRVMQLPPVITISP